MEKWSSLEPFCIFVFLILGYLMSFNPAISMICGNVEEYALVILLFFIFLEIDWINLKKGLLNRNFLATDVIINFLWTPLLAWLLGILFFKDSVFPRIALVLLLVLPCTDWYLIFTEMTGGNIALSASVLPFNLGLQLLVLPICLLTIFGKADSFLESEVAAESVFELLVPLLAAIIVRLLLKKAPEIQEKIHHVSDKIEFALVCLVAFAIFAAEGRELVISIGSFPLFILAVVIFYILNFSLSFFVAKKLDYTKEDLISLVFVSTSRNTPLSLTLAGLLYPQYRIISVILLMGPLTEIPFSLIVSTLLKKLTHKTVYPKLKKHYN